MVREWWFALVRGDTVESANGDFVGEVVGRSEAEVRVHDPVEDRELTIPREVCEERAGGGIRLRQRPVRSAGTGPERYRRRRTLDEEWVEQHSERQRAVVVEGADPLHAVHAEEPEPGDGASDSNSVDSDDNLPTELEHG